MEVTREQEWAEPKVEAKEVASPRGVAVPGIKVNVLPDTVNNKLMVNITGLEDGDQVVIITSDGQLRLHSGGMWSYGVVCTSDRITTNRSG